MKITEIRRDYGKRKLTENNLSQNPFNQFTQWLTEAIDNKLPDPTAMVLATVDEKGLPDVRVLLLKDIINNKFIFYTNYQSRKAQQLKANHLAALNFYWPGLARQIRIRGSVEKTAENISDSYFATRPQPSQISAIISPQSQVVASREILQQQWEEATTQYQEKDTIARPNYWGGYQLTAQEFEFWQGRDNRLHDRIHYTLQGDQWRVERLAP